MTEPNSYAALSFLLYVIAICVLLSFIYIAVDWLYEKYQAIQYDRKRKVERLEDEIARLRKEAKGS